MAYTPEFRCHIYDGDTTDDHYEIAPDADGLELFVLRRYVDGEPIAEMIMPPEQMKALAHAMLKTIGLNIPPREPGFAIVNKDVIKPNGLVFPPVPGPVLQNDPVMHIQH